MNQKIVSGICVIGLILALMVPSLVQAQDATPEEEDAVYYVGSVFLSLLYLPIKLVTCVGVQAVTIPTYLFTNGVPGNFEGGTNGKEIAEVARSACVTPWVVPFDKVKSEEPTAERVIVKQVVEKKIVIKEVLKIIKVERIVLPDIAFRFDSADLTELGKGIIFLASMQLKEKADTPVVIEGHADFMGTEEYNKGLGLRRAQSVKNEMEQQGIAPERLRATSLGESKPLIDQDTDWARAANRRVELRFNSH